MFGFLGYVIFASPEVFREMSGDNVSFLLFPICAGIVMVIAGTVIVAIGRGIYLAIQRIPEITTEEERVLAENIQIAREIFLGIGITLLLIASIWVFGFFISILLTGTETLAKDRLALIFIPLGVGLVVGGGSACSVILIRAIWLAIQPIPPENPV